MCDRLAALKLPLAAAFLAVAIIALACGAGDSESQAGVTQPEVTQPVAERDRTIVGSEGFPFFYSDRTLDSMVEESALIVIGTIQDRRLVSSPEPFEYSEPCGTPNPLNAGKEGCVDGVSTVRGMLGGYKSEYTLSIEETIKSDGQARAAITIVEAGGIVDGSEIWYAGIPLYEPGARYLLFLRWRNSGGFVGMATALDGLFGTYTIADGMVGDLDVAPEFDGQVRGNLIGLDETAAKSLIDQSLARLETP